MKYCDFFTTRASLVSHVMAMEPEFAKSIFENRGDEEQTTSKHVADDDRSMDRFDDPGAIVLNDTVTDFGFVVVRQSESGVDENGGSLYRTPGWPRGPWELCTCFLCRQRDGLQHDEWRIRSESAPEFLVDAAFLDSELMFAGKQDGHEVGFFLL